MIKWETDKENPNVRYFETPHFTVTIVGDGKTSRWSSVTLFVTANSDDIEEPILGTELQGVNTLEEAKSFAIRLFRRWLLRDLDVLGPINEMN